jgi:hypothetical protein
MHTLLSGSDVPRLAAVLAHRQMYPRLDWLRQQQQAGAGAARPHGARAAGAAGDAGASSGGSSSSSSSGSSSAPASVLRLLHAPAEEFEGWFPGFAAWQA